MNKNKLPKTLLRIEGLIIFLTSLIIYFSILDESLKFFLILFLFPDLSFFAYLINNKTGSYIYNLLHTYTLPIILLAYSFYSLNNLGVLISIIWFTHIGMDRAIGYGLKYTDEFKHTHLQEA